MWWPAARASLPPRLSGTSERLSRGSRVTLEMLRSSPPAPTPAAGTSWLIDTTAERIQKRGMAIATWYTSERHAQVSGTDCTLLLRGNTGKMRTYLFSRIVRGLLLQSYEVAEPGGLTPFGLKSTESAVLAYMNHYDIRWSFVYFVSNGHFSKDAVTWSRQYRRKEIGILLVDVRDHLLEFAPDMLLSRHAAKFIRF